MAALVGLAKILNQTLTNQQISKRAILFDKII